MKIQLTLIYTFMFLLFASCSNNISKEMVGNWKVTDLKVDIKNVPKPLIQNAKILALATKYEFKNNGTYCMTISKNALENGRKHKGTMSVSTLGKQITLNTDTLLFEEYGKWKLIEKNNSNSAIFNSISMKIEKVSPNQIVLSESETSRTLIYTLDRIVK